METQSLAQIATAHPKLKDIMLLTYNELIAKTPTNVHVVVDQVYRSVDESNALYNKGRNATGVIINQSEVVSNAKGGQSWHNYGLAWDIHMVRNGNAVWFDTTPEAADKAAADKDYSVIIKIMEDNGFNWGGDFPGHFRDVPHFENKMFHKLSDLFAKYQAGDFIPGTKYVNI